jgi:hypothetical protein
LDDLESHGIDISADQILQALEMGFPESQVVKAIESNGWGLFPSFDQLLDTIQALETAGMLQALDAAESAEPAIQVLYDGINGGGGGSGQPTIAAEILENPLLMAPVRHTVETDTGDLPDTTAAAAASTVPEADFQAIRREMDQIREEKTCKICADTEATVVFVPCGHMMTCVYCSGLVNACPICRKPIQARVRTFTA